MDSRSPAAVDVGPEILHRHLAAVLAPVSLYRFDLLGCEIVGIDLFEPFGVDKYLVGIGKIAVHVVEVVDQHVAPESESVEVKRVVGRKSGLFFEDPAVLPEHDKQCLKASRARENPATKELIVLVRMFLMRPSDSSSTASRKNVAERLLGNTKHTRPMSSASLAI